VAVQQAASGVYVFASYGDRRGDIDLYMAQIIQRRGQREAQLLLKVEYFPDRDWTRVVIDTSSVEWRRRLSWLRGWRRVRTP
jgi:hypothetical protein